MGGALIILKYVVIVIGIILMVLTFSLLSILFLIFVGISLTKKIGGVNMGVFLSIIYFIIIIVSLALASVSPSPSSPGSNVNFYCATLYESGITVNSSEDAKSVVDEYLTVSNERDYVESFDIGDTKSRWGDDTYLYDIDVVCNESMGLNINGAFCTLPQIGSVKGATLYGVSEDGRICAQIMHLNQ